MTAEKITENQAEASHHLFIQDLESIFPENVGSLEADAQRLKPVLETRNDLYAGPGAVSIEEKDGKDQITITFASTDTLTSDRPKDRDLRVEEGTHALHLGLNPELRKKSKERNKLNQQERDQREKDISIAPLLVQANAEVYAAASGKRFLDRLGLEPIEPVSTHDTLNKILDYPHLNKATLLRIYGALFIATNQSESDTSPELQQALTSLKLDAEFEHQRSIENLKAVEEKIEVLEEKKVEPVVIKRRRPSTSRMRARVRTAFAPGDEVAEVEDESRWTNPTDRIKQEVARLSKQLDEPTLAKSLKQVGVDAGLFSGTDMMVQDKLKKLDAEQVKKSLETLLEKNDLSDADLFAVAAAIGEDILQLKDEPNPDKKKVLIEEITVRLRSKVKDVDFNSFYELERARGALMGLREKQEKQGIGRAVFEIALFNYGLFNDFSVPLSADDKAKLSSPGYLQSYLEMIRTTLRDPSFTYFGDNFNPYALVEQPNEADAHVQEQIADLLSKVSSGDQYDSSIFMTMARDLVTKQEDVAGKELESLGWSIQRQLDYIWAEKGLQLSPDALFELPGIAIEQASQFSQVLSRQAEQSNEIDLLMEPVAKVVAALSIGKEVTEISFGGGMMASYSALISDESEVATDAKNAWLKKLATVIKKAGYPALKEILQQPTIQEQQQVVKKFLKS